MYMLSIKKIKKYIPKIKKTKKFYVFFMLLSLCGLLATALTLYHLYFLGRIYPGVRVAGYKISGKTEKEAISFLSNKITPPQNITLRNSGQVFNIPLSSISFSYDFEKTVNNIYFSDRFPNHLESLYKTTLYLFRNANYPLEINFDEEKLKDNLSVVAEQVSVESVYPSVKYESGEVVINTGSPGKEINQEIIIKEIRNNLSEAKFSPININTVFVDPTLSQEEALLLEQRATNLLDKNLAISFEFQEFNYSKNDLFKLLDGHNGYIDKEIGAIIDTISLNVERNPQNPVFIFADGKVKEFSPARDGVKVEKEKLLSLIKESLQKLESSEDKKVSINIPTVNTPPDYNTEEVNNLGIKELLGRGTSRYVGSIASRVHNIALAAGKFNGVLVKPGEIFSFNNSLGDVSAFTGYQQAYVIKDGKTVLGDGGGVCQVSTTFFRAALDAGLPIIERRAHSYRVGYYEQDSAPGIDATVYAPTTDLKVKNDTPNHILIQTITDTNAKTLAFEIYGTSDGRKSTITKPIVTDVTPPPEDLYIDDPTLPAGTIKQIDWKAWGAKASFNYTVERNGELIYEKTFYSNFRPWQAKFLRGTSPAQ
jgi:vancomycin resistance protein YoaR